MDCNGQYNTRVLMTITATHVVLLVILVRLALRKRGLLALATWILVMRSDTTVTKGENQKQWARAKHQAASQCLGLCPSHKQMCMAQSLCRRSLIIEQCCELDHSAAEFDPSTTRAGVQRDNDGRTVFELTCQTPPYL